MKLKLPEKLDTLVSDKNKYFVLGMVLLIQFIFYMIIGLNREIWEDEAYSLRTSSYNLLEIIIIALKFENNPPLYFILLNLWRNFGPSIFFSRLLSIVLTIAGTWVLSKILRNYIHKYLIIFLIIFVVLNPFIIFIAITIRYYSLVFLMSVLIIYLSLKQFLWNDPKPKQIAIFSLISTLGITTQFQIAFLLFALGVGILIIRGSSIFIKYAYSMVIPLILFSLKFIFLFQSLEVYAELDNTEFSLYNLYFVLVSWVQYFLGFFHFFWDYSNLFYWIFRISLLVLLLNFIFNKPFAIFKEYKLLYFSILSSIILIAIFLFSLFIFSQKEFLQAWHTMIILPGFLIILSYLIKHGKFKYISMACTIILLIIQLLSIENISKNKLSSYFNEVSEYLKEENIKNKELFVFPAETALIAKYELPKYIIYAVPVEIDFFGRFDHKQWILKSDEQLLIAIENNTHQKDTLQLLVKKDFKSLYNVDYNVDILDTFLADEKRNILVDTTFTKLRYIKFTINQ